MIRQLSVFVENRPGSFRQVTELLRQHRIETEAFCSVDSPEFGILRLIVDQPEEAEHVLAAQGLLIKNYDVIEVAVEDMESLDALLLACTESNVNINYMYSSFGGGTWSVGDFPLRISGGDRVHAQGEGLCMPLRFCSVFSIMRISVDC